MLHKAKVVYDVVCEYESGSKYQDNALICGTDAYYMFIKYRDMMNLPESKEAFLCAYLNSQHDCIAIQTVSIGTLNMSLVHPRETFRAAIALNANYVVICHNHPTGKILPSDQDNDVTNRLKESGRILGIGVVDHIIIGPESSNPDSFYSYNQGTVYL